MSERHAAHPLLGELEELIASRESPPRSERLIYFARVLLGRTLHERLRTFDLEELYRQTCGLYDFADARGLQPIAVRMVESPPAGIGARGQPARRAVPRRHGARRRAGRRPQRAPAAASHRRRRARRRGPHRARRRCARGERARVGHAAGARAASRPRGGRGARRGRARGARGSCSSPWATSRRCSRWSSAWRRPRMGPRACAPPRRSRRRRRSSSGCATATSSCSAPAPTRVEDGAVGARGAGAGRLGSRHPARRRRVALRASRRRVNELPEFLRERLVASGDLLVIGKTNRRSRVHRRARMDDVSVRVLRPGRHDRGPAARDRPVHVARLPRAGLAHAAPAPQAAGDHRGRGPDGGLARLQGDGRRVRVVPARRAVPGPDRRAARRDRRGRARRGGAARHADGAARRRQPQHHGHGRDAGRPHVDRAAHAPAGAARGALSTPSRWSTTSRSSRTRRRSSSSCCTSRRARRPTCRSTSSSRRSPGSRARGTTAWPTSSWRATATPRAGGSRRSTPRACPTTTRPPRRPTSRSPTSRCSSASPPARRSRSACRTSCAAHTQVGARPLTRVTVATPGGKIPLGELLPVLEALGLTVMEEVPTRLDGGDDGAYLHDFGVLVDDAQLDCERDGERLAEAITADLERARRVGHAERARRARRPARRRRRDPARLPPLPPHRCADVHRGVPERRAVRRIRRRRARSSSCSARASASAPDEAREAELRARARRAARRPWAASTRTASCAASPR